MRLRPNPRPKRPNQSEGPEKEVWAQGCAQTSRMGALRRCLTCNCLRKGVGFGRFGRIGRKKGGK
jgi:hypothetical protein